MIRLDIDTTSSDALFGLSAEPISKSHKNMVIITDEMNKIKNAITQFINSEIRQGSAQLLYNPYSDVAQHKIMQYNEQTPKLTTAQNYSEVRITKQQQDISKETFLILNYDTKYRFINTITRLMQKQLMEPFADLRVRTNDEQKYWYNDTSDLLFNIVKNLGYNR